MNLIRVIIGCSLLLGCVTTTTLEPPRPELPVGVDGYNCGRRENFPGGVVQARAQPDYRGGYVTLSMSWEMFSTGVGTPEVLMHWESGRRWAGTFLTVTAAVYPLPPLGTQISLRLSSGEVIAQTFIEPRNWREWSHHSYSGYGGHVFTDDLGFMEAFTRAQWADIDITARGGLALGHTRLDLSDLPEQIETMRSLRAAVETAAANYEHACVPYFEEAY
jgi:hypothetical protein